MSEQVVGLNKGCWKSVYLLHGGRQPQANLQTMPFILSSKANALKAQTSQAQGNVQAQMQMYTYVLHACMVCTCMCTHPQTNKLILRGAGSVKL